MVFAPVTLARVLPLESSPTPPACTRGVLLIHNVLRGHTGYRLQKAVAVAIVHVGDAVGLQQGILEALHVAQADRHRGVPVGVVGGCRQLIVRVVVRRPAPIPGSVDTFCVRLPTGS